MFAVGQRASVRLLASRHGFQRPALVRYAETVQRGHRRDNGWPIPSERCLRADGNFPGSRRRRLGPSCPGVRWTVCSAGDRNCDEAAMPGTDARAVEGRRATHTKGNRMKPSGFSRRSLLQAVAALVPSGLLASASGCAPTAEEGAAENPLGSCVRVGAGCPTHRRRRRRGVWWLDGAAPAQKGGPGDAARRLGARSLAGQLGR